MTNTLKPFGRFVFHTVLGGLVVLVMTPLVISPLEMWLRATESRYIVYLASVPFPTQCMVGLVMGYFWHRKVQHKEALWAWALPLCWLMLRFAAAPNPDPGVLFSDSQMSRWELFFGHSFSYDADFSHQLVVRMAYVAPFFASASYSIGALLHRANVFPFERHKENAVSVSTEEQSEAAPSAAQGDSI